MQPFDFVLLAYDAFDGEIKGSTNFQKKIYFLSIMLGRDDLGYDAHYYGPYSALIAGVNRHLKSLGFVEERVASGGIHDQRGFEVARHDFELTDDGKTIVQSLKKRNASEAERIREAAKKLKDLGDVDYVQLSIAAKAYFLLSQADTSLSHGELVEKARQFKWNVGESDIERAVDSLSKLGLVTEA